ncbi:response regulator transcription factor [Thiothrix lacustris]|uniref:Response regulator transcription factor n=1 Tax=Thiothrix lacustris TaxID=525917 RepID=A0ABY9MPC2_9GAMM|nr:response regulator transcription factor [Thiothrix lacustris]WML89716.1 response regulator transcription factor [Thiothrix lacustris]
MNILLADDHALFREGMALLLNQLFPQATIIHANSWVEVHQVIHQYTLSLALLDLSMPGQQAWEEELTDVMSVVTGVACIVSGSSSQEHIKTAFGMGVKGYIPKTMAMADMVSALQCLMAGGIYLPDKVWLQTTDFDTSSLLTWRQRELLTFLAQGKSNKQMATLLTLTEGTVKRHLHNIFRILDANNRLEAVNIARERNLLLKPEA